MYGTKPTSGVDDNRVRKYLDHVKVVFEELTVSGVEEYKKKIFRVLGEGWITTEGEKYQIKMQNSFNSFISAFASCANDVIEMFQDAVEEVVINMDPKDPYEGLKITVDSKKFKSEGKARDGGYRFIFDDKIDEARSAIEKFGESVDKCCRSLLLSLNDDAFGVVDDGDSIKSAFRATLEEEGDKALKSVNYYIEILDKVLGDVSAAAMEARDNAVKKMNNQFNFTANYES